MAAKLLVLYNKPADAAAFDHHYQSTHIPLAKKLPGLRSYMISDGAVAVPEGDSPYHLVAELTFDSVAHLQAALASPEGQAAVADLDNFAGAGVTICMYEMKEA